MTTAVLEFFKDLAQNNNRDWFQLNKSRYEDTKAIGVAFYEALYQRLLAIDEWESYRMYRIYRDIRFSPDKTPYKTHFGGSYKRKQPENRGSFYVQIEPGNSFIACGFWNPNKEDLFRIRKAIEREDDLEVILAQPEVIDAFGGLNGEQLKTAPKDFNKAHPRIELLKFKQFMLIHHFSDAEVLQADFIDQIVANYQLMRPFLNYMTEVLTLDENGSPLY